MGCAGDQGDEPISPLGSQAGLGAGSFSAGNGHLRVHAGCGKKLAFLKGSHSLLFTLYTNFQGNLEHFVFFIYALTAAGTQDSLLFI